MNTIPASLFMGFLLLSTGSSIAQEPLSFVDPNIGGVGLILEPTRPTVQLPNQMIRSYPGRKDYLDDQITTFPLTLVSHRQGHLFGIMPFTGKADTDVEPVSSWDGEHEVSTPYYFSEWLEDYDITIEFTPGSKAGYFRILYPALSPKGLLLRIATRGGWKSVSGRVVTGEEHFNGMKAWVYGEFSQEGRFNLVVNKTGREQGIMTWPEDLRALEFKYAISFISAEQAKNNLENEIPGWNFDEMKSSARHAWEKILGQIEVEGATDSRKRTFYTALYRCYERMVDITEDGRYYSNYDRQIHRADRPFYVDDWIWDTYLALHPLRCILQPSVEADMIASYVRMYEQSGWLPTFPILWGDTPCMNGFHSAIMITDAYHKGIRNFNIKNAYEGMKKNALQATMLPWRNGPACSLDSFYHRQGFYPALHPGEKETVALADAFEKRQSVAVTLGHSYDDWALARMAEVLGNSADQALFLERSRNYRKLYHKEKGFFMPKDGQGEWINIDPTFDGGMGGRDYYDENNGWTYLWQVQHDIPGLMDLMGGKDIFENRLDQLFREDLGRSKYENWAKFPDFTGIVGQFSMGNEPSFHIPYLYNYTRSPWKTQKKIRMLLDTWFPDNIFGIPGDEDGGGMSAFIVFSCMGFYPVVPGIPVYTIGSPVFEKITLHLPDNKDFIVSAPGCSGKNKYIQQAYLNGKLLSGPWFSHTDLMNGGELKLLMGPLPEKAWGTNPESMHPLIQTE
ncbi:MAG: GH92 family glycosyl hydrolase [Bacteroidales bacterium]|nr:GH92 family glycosyl hydrolase [Bacteroidales bacterium]